MISFVNKPEVTNQVYLEPDDDADEGTTVLTDTDGSDSTWTIA